MSHPPARVAALRHILAERFPSVCRSFDEFAAPRVLATGIQALDAALGGLPLSAITELVCAAPSCGSELFISALLDATRRTRTRVALVDGFDSFDPSSLEQDRLAHLLWVRAQTTAEALQAADLLARDANLGLVLLDLRRAPETDLKRTPATQWYRFQRAVENTDLALLVETPRAAVPSAQLRLRLESSLPNSAHQCEQNALIAQLAPVIQRQRLAMAAG